MRMALPRMSVIFVLAQALTTFTETNGQESGILPAIACKAFASGRSSAHWTHEDCVEVWTQFTATVSDGLRRRHPEVDIWRDTALELRREGSPCILTSGGGGDGLGSTTMRNIATWVYAQEMGCDWLTPDWGRKKVDQGDGEADLYCHAVVSKEVVKAAHDLEELRGMRRCSVVDWLSYFQFDQISVKWPESGSVRVVTVRKKVITFSNSIVCWSRSRQQVVGTAW